MYGSNSHKATGAHILLVVKTTQLVGQVSCLGHLLTVKKHNEVVNQQVNKNVMTQPLDERCEQQGMISIRKNDSHAQSITRAHLHTKKPSTADDTDGSNAPQLSAVTQLPRSR
jgi:hypothetical protein